MTIVAETYRYVVGIDTHAEQHTYALLTSNGACQDLQSFATTTAGIDRAIAWIARRTDGDLDQVLIVVEGAGSYGRIAAARFTRTGYTTVEAMTPTRADLRTAKSDPLDAARIARTVLGTHPDRLRRPRTGHAGQLAALLLADRDALNSDRTAKINQLTALARTHSLGIDARTGLTTTQITTITTWRARHEDPLSAHARQIAIRTAKAITTIDKLLKANQTDLETLTRQTLPDLHTQTGYGPVSLARAICTYSTHARIRNADAFAALAGTCPIPASSGKHQRMRLNRGGDRRLNAATYTIALTRMHHDAATRDYVTRRRAEGKTDREIRRCLKNYIARNLYRALKRADLSQTP